MDSVDILLVPFPREYSYGYNYDYFLENVVSRIVAKYGAFRKLKISSFHDMNDYLDDNDNLKQKQDSNISDKFDLNCDVQQIKEKLINMISNAQNECSLVLDFVSMLVSSVKPALGNSSMSTFLKERIPVGSFGTESVRGDIFSEDFVVSKGWKLQALSKVTSDLLDASVKIDKEITLEAKFWDQVNILRQNGWNLMHSRVGQDKNFVINYGIMDVSRIFGRGFAILKRGIDGDVKFDGVDMFETFKITRLRFSENDVIKGEVVWDNSSFSEFFDKNTQILSQRRDSFFEEELLEEIIKEINFFDDLNAVILDNGISVEIMESKRVLLLDIVDASTKTNKFNQEYDVLCEIVLLALHLFFSYYESQKLKWVDSFPFLSKIQNKKQTRILFPIVSQLSHYFILDEISKELKNCVDVILAEGWTVDYKIKKYVDTDFGISEDSIIESIVNGSRSVIEMYLPGSSQIIIDIHTVDYKTSFEIDFHNIRINGVTTSKTVCGSILETLECIIWSINKDFVNVLQEAVTPNWEIKNGELVNINNTMKIKMEVFIQRNEDGMWKIFLYKNGTFVHIQDKISDVLNKIL
ncbi:hypothetical protein T552_02540 [Pneumocystis carinii B80]|uniref:Mediator of RNA polymerase II transcription subunit 17 n=1 Tax=Pneumocystis carinii (strain B80) TaxID=1408658 RepID=A0A0W4ZFB2_PNEC8|nr:hypothetical protein T552_02540 [Pneumocystis carinii B80]KTW27048.1 hypothetical protein T552_02540 [Pneumocystis carinii B80]